MGDRHQVSLGKLTLTAPFHELIPRQLRANGVQLLTISPEHLNGLIALPFHHRDPFDPILVSQVRVENATIVSVDVVLDSYGVARLW